MIRSTLAILLAINGAIAANSCTNVHIFVARGNDEPYPGRQGALTDKICSHFTSCDAEHIEYDNPASPACDALTKGPALGIAQINAYAQRCPDTQIVLTGYSQGGQTMGDILGGGGGQFWDCVEPTNAGYDPNSGVGAKIVAALLWGDARHTANQGYNVQSGSGKDGYFPRSGDQLSSLGKWNDRLRSYCVITDPICARGNDGHTHETYFDIYGDDAATWVASKVRKAAVSPPPSSLVTVVSTSASSAASSSVTGSVSSASSSASGSASGSASSSAAVDAQAVGSSSVSSASNGAYTITTIPGVSSSSSALPWQSTVSASYFYPVMATNTLPPGTTYSTAPTSIPASNYAAIVSATTTASYSSPSSGFGGNGTFGSATPSITPFKGGASVTQISGLMFLAALVGIAAL